jgi:hypothetical protein
MELVLERGDLLSIVFWEHRHGFMKSFSPAQPSRDSANPIEDHY